MKEFIKALKKLFKQKKGFTLIELLVVIGILGILAAALVATIDPFEQLNKAQDANTKNTLVEFVDANIRYYSSQLALPWNDPNATACEALSSTIYSGVSLVNVMPCVSQLVADSEVKDSFTTVTGILQQINIHGSATDVTACFQPKSKADKVASDVTWNSTGTANACSPTSGTCYWCSR
jgi:prepilin-type N-terminal cleavage/methylation domain-containing protein